MSLRVGESSNLSYLLAKMLFPVFSQAGQAAVKLEASDRATEALVAALEMKARTGSYPSAISDLPGNLTDPFTKKPLKLITKGDSVTVYSLGPDRKDDGGRSEHDPSRTLGYDIAASYPLEPSSWGK